MKRRVGRHGYTLVEVMVAIVILAIALPGLVSLVVGGRRTQVASLRMDQGSSIAQLVLDSLQLRPASLASNGTFTRSVGGRNYTVSVVLSQLAALDESRLATVRVTWTQAGKAHGVVAAGVVR